MDGQVRRSALVAALATVTMLFADASLAADDAKTRTDLTATIALQGLPCGQVTSAVRQAENDYIATCQDGNRYRVYVNAQGRVVVQKQ